MKANSINPPESSQIFQLHKQTKGTVGKVCDRRGKWFTGSLARVFTDN